MSEKLTDLPGVGPKTAENLRMAGYGTYSAIADEHPDRLAFKVDGIGEKGAKKIVKAAGGSIPSENTKSEEERLQETYGEVFAKIDETPATEIEDAILGRRITDFDSTEATLPGDTALPGTDEEDAFSPFRVEVKGPGKRSVNKIHQSRSERAQDVDEQQNAPITRDEEKWIKNKNRLDYPGVDTVPKDRQRKRAEKAADVAQSTGALDRVEQKGSAKTLGGKFSPPGSDTYGRGEAVARVQNTASQPERTLAHEVGHAFDYLVGDDPNNPGLQDVLFEGDGRNDEARKVSERARGGGSYSYRASETELAADVLSQAILNPRATKREAPNLFERVEDAADEYGFAEAIPDPLESDPEPMGFLK
jgi:hypothetical protein